MKYMDAKAAAEKWGVSPLRVTELCRGGEVPGALKSGRVWRIPEDSPKPGRRSRKSDNREADTRLPLPIGVSDFVSAVTKYCYVDKTLMIRDFLDTIPKVSLFTRPRRFGKTLNMDMLRVFFEKTDQDTSIYFRDTDIWKCGEKYRSEQGKYPVIFLSFKDARQKNWTDALSHISSLLSSEFSRHSDVLDDRYCTEEEKAYFITVIERKASSEELTRSLAMLSLMLEKRHGIPPVIIVDEYDTPVEQGWLNGFYDEAISFTRMLFSGAFKDNMHMSWGFLTGILRIAKESIFSGLNNLREFSVLDERFGSYFGFTSSEVKKLLALYGGEDRYEEVSSWYDGYLFGKDEVFNPWSVMNYIDSGFSPRAWWANTGNNEVLRNLLRNSPEEVRTGIQTLLNGEDIVTDVSSSIVYPLMDRAGDSVWSFLLASGYLSPAGETHWHGVNATCILRIPDREVFSVYADEIKAAFIPAVSSSISIRIREALLQGNAEELEKSLSEFLRDTISCFDTYDEIFYHGLMLGLTSQMNGMYALDSNRESGLGRYDIGLKPLVSGLPGIIIELKAGHADIAPGNVDSVLTEMAMKGLAQIDDREYDRAMRKEGVSRIMKIGIAFLRKNVKTVSRTDSY